MSESGEATDVESDEVLKEKVLKEALQTARGEADILNALAPACRIHRRRRRRAGNLDRRGPGRLFADGPGDGAERGWRAPGTTALAPDDSRRNLGE